MKDLITIKNLYISADNIEILKGLSLSIKEGEVHALMGPNGSGKSSLALTLAGHPKFKVTNGSISYKNIDLTTLSADKRAQEGLFLSFQNPCEIEGVSLREFLYASKKNCNPVEFEKLLTEKMKLLDLTTEFVERSVNFRFSGGEKKQAEILQLAVLKPKLAILDEIDSGLDIDALKKVCNCINKAREDNPSMSLLIITHYPRIFQYVVPDTVHVMNNGKIVKSGKKELADLIEKEGYSF